MSTLNPPIALEKPDNQARVDYIQDYASGMYYKYICIYTKTIFFFNTNTTIWQFFLSIDYMGNAWSVRRLFKSRMGYFFL